MSWVYGLINSSIISKSSLDNLLRVDSMYCVEIWLECCIYVLCPSHIVDVLHSVHFYKKHLFFWSWAVRYNRLEKIFVERANNSFCVHLFRSIVRSFVERLYKFIFIIFSSRKYIFVTCGASCTSTQAHRLSPNSCHLFKRREEDGNNNKKKINKKCKLIRVEMMRLPKWKQVDEVI